MPSELINPKIQAAYASDLLQRYQKLEKVADKTIQSFATLVDEIAKLKQVSAGTEAKEKVAHLANEMNNSSVFLTKMLSDQLTSIHSIISPASNLEEGTEAVV